MVKRYIELYLAAKKALAPEYGAQAGNVARQLLGAVSGKSAEAIIADCDIYASEEIEAKLTALTARALAGEPLAYLLGQWDFAGMTLTVTRDTLIPRDDTMAVTELAIWAAMGLPAQPRILDLCTGTGCIGLAIARRVMDARVVLGDVSPAAVRVAKTNVQALHLSGRVTCLTLDACKPAAAFLGQFDLLVANPPYVTEAEMATLPRSVADYEPHLALCGGVDGLALYRELLKNYSPALRPGGYVCFEFGMGQEADVCGLLTADGYEIITLKRDLRNVIRAVLARKKREDETYGNQENGL